MNTNIENNLGGEKGENLITKRELACRLKRTVRTITNWQRRGIIPYVRWRHAVYFDWQAVQASLQPRQGLLDFAAADAPGSSAGPVAQRDRQVACATQVSAGRRVTGAEFLEVKGPMRLPVYQMREEAKTKTKTKCRGLSGRRREGTVRPTSANSAAKPLRNGRGSEARAKAVGTGRACEEGRNYEK